jgi:hypothetical protein
MNVCTWCEELIEGQPKRTIHRVCESLQRMQQHTPLAALRAVEVPGPARAYYELLRGLR